MFSSLLSWLDHFTIRGAHHIDAAPAPATWELAVSQTLSTVKILQMHFFFKFCMISSDGALPVHADAAATAGLARRPRRRRIVMTRGGGAAVLTDKGRVRTVLVPAGHVRGGGVHVAA
jgi:hypothetical protein